MSRKDEWPTAAQLRRPDLNRVKELIARYAGVVRDELPPQQRPKFRLRPEDLLRPIS